MSFNRERFKAHSDKLRADALKKMKDRDDIDFLEQEYTPPVDTKKKIKGSGKSRVFQVSC